MRNTRGWKTVVLALGVCAAGAMGCSRYGAYCTDKADCDNGNDSDIDACIASLDHDEERADIWNCTDEWDRYFECVEENAHCDANDYYTADLDCAYDAEDLHACIN